MNFLQSAFLQSKQDCRKAAYLQTSVNGIIGHDKCYKEAGINVSLDAINNYLNSVAVTDDHDDSESFVFPSGEWDNEFIFTEVDVSTAVAHLCALDIKKSTGPDGYF